MPVTKLIMRKISLTLLLLLTISKIYAQEKSDLQRLMPKRFVDKVEIVTGSNINFPNERDQIAGKNPDISIRYYPKAGYLAGIGLIHTIKNIELRARVLWDQRSYGNDFSITSTKYEFITDAKNSYLTFALIPTISFGKSKRFYFILG